MKANKYWLFDSPGKLQKTLQRSGIEKQAALGGGLDNKVCGSGSTGWWGMAWLIYGLELMHNPGYLIGTGSSMEDLVPIRASFLKGHHLY